MNTTAFSIQPGPKRKTCNHYRISVLVVVMLIGFFTAAASALELRLNDEHVFAYASYLYHQGEYYRAISEYKRLLYFFPTSEFVSPARLQIGRAYMAGDRLEDAIAYWNRQLEQEETPLAEFQRVRILLGISLLDLNQTEPFRFREKKLQQAFEVFDSLDGKDPAAALFVDFSREWRNRDLGEKRSPWLAGSLSAIVPGAGSFYSGRYLEGTYAFLLTALFYLATQDAIHHTNDELGILFGFLTLSFYGGSIYTAVNGVHKLNDKMEADELLRIREKYGVWFIPATQNYPGRF